MASASNKLADLRVGEGGIARKSRRLSVPRLWATTGSVAADIPSAINVKNLGNATSSRCNGWLRLLAITHLLQR
jgi:hypothetical protein